MAHRRALHVLAGVLAGLLLVGVLWILVTGLVARSRLESIGPQLHDFRSAVAADDLDRAQRIGREIEQRAGSAHQLTSGPAWWVGSHLLGVGTPLRTTRDVSLVLDRLSHQVLPSLPAVSADLHAGGSAGNLDLARLEAIRTRLTRIRGLVHQSVSAVRATPASWLGPVAGGRDSALTKLSSVDSDLGGAHRAVDTLVPMLGADRPQRYFVGFMNEAEARSIGGLPGAFAIITVDHGRIGVEHIGSDLELTDVRADVDLGSEYNALYKQDDPTGVIQNSDIGPSFPDAARIWAGMWRAKTGEHVDGALAIDPSALGYLLRGAGPTRLADGTLITGQNVTTLAESREYFQYPGLGRSQNLERKQFLASIAQAVAARLLHHGSLRQLVAPLRQSVREHRIVVWSDNASRERTIAAAGIGGVLRPGHSPYSGFLVNNASGSKLDFYLHRSMTYHSRSCGATRTATASFTLANETPSYHLPAYVTYVAGGRPAGEQPGWNQLIVTYYASPGARIDSVTLNGRAQHLIPATEDSLTSVRLMVALPADARARLTVKTTENGRSGPVQIAQQPLVYPLHVHSEQTTCLADRAGPLAAGIPSGPASTGSPWPALALGLLALILVLMATWALTAAAARSGERGTTTRIDALRDRVSTRSAKVGALAFAALAAVAGVLVVFLVTAVLGKATKTRAVVRPDRPVYRFFLEHRAGWLTSPLAVITHIGEYPEMTAIALAAALVLGFGLTRFRIPALVVLTALFIWPFISFGRFYDWVDVVALVVFLVLAVIRRENRSRWVACVVLMATMPVEKHLQIWMNSVVHGTVPPLTEAYAPVGPFPSGGCTRIVLITGLVAVLFAREYRSRHASLLLALGAVAISYVEGFSRIYLGKHWFVDCLGGFFFGGALLVVVAGALRVYAGPGVLIDRRPTETTAR